LARSEIATQRRSMAIVLGEVKSRPPRRLLFRGNTFARSRGACNWGTRSCRPIDDQSILLFECQYHLRHPTGKAAIVIPFHTGSWRGKQKPERRNPLCTRFIRLVMCRCADKWRVSRQRARRMKRLRAITALGLLMYRQCKHLNATERSSRKLFGLRATQSGNWRQFIRGTAQEEAVTIRFLCFRRLVGKCRTYGSQAEAIPLWSYLSARTGCARFSRKLVTADTDWHNWQ
jgi:hypothetical protein